MNFYQTVKAMRETQKAYFKTRDKGLLIRSKELEAQVDKWLQYDFTYITLMEKKVDEAHGGVSLSELP